MRLDLLLNRLCLFKTRSQAGKACDGGRVWINEQKAKSSRTVEAGDRIRYRDELSRFEEDVEVLEIPKGSVSKARAKEMYRVLERREIERPWSASG